MSIPRFDLTPNEEIGTLFFMGNDELGNRVYVLGLGADHRLLSYLVDRYLDLLGFSPHDYRLVNCLRCVNWLTRIGGYSSRSLGLVWLGRRLAALGVCKSFRHYIRLVEQVRSSERQEPDFLDGHSRV